MAVLEPLRSGYYVWKYLPSIEAAVIFCILWIIATFCHVWRIWKTRAWFGIPFAVGGFMEFIGYATRASAHSKTGKLMPFAVQNMMILLAPVLFAASVYMTLGRVVRAVRGERHALVRPGRLTRLFVTGDVLALAVQGGGGGMMVVGSLARAGQGIVVGGLVVQIVIFGVFCFTAARFHRGMRRDLGRAGRVAAPPRGMMAGWEQTLRMLYAVSGLVMARSVFRVVEFVQGHDGYLLSTEWPNYVFDAVPMLVAMAIFGWWWPSVAGSAGTEDEELGGRDLFAGGGNGSAVKLADSSTAHPPRY